MKKNGFSPPLNTFQILTWCIYLMNFLVILVGLLPYMDKESGNAILLSFTLFSQILLGVLGFEATRSNPQIVILTESEA